ncbi:MAG: hypothetical protein IPI43_28175 [Sandaracinaceae bacterium]|nr:hypothetical protein [Sandaracinaceae bacterium]
MADNSSTDGGVVYVYTAWRPDVVDGHAHRGASHGPGDQFGSALRLSGDGMTLAVEALRSKTAAPPA